MGTPEVIDIAAEFDEMTEMWSPKAIAGLNDYEIKLVKLHGEFEWHSHETDKLFLVVDGVMRLQMRDRTISVGPGQFCVVPGGVENCPAADSETCVLLLEPVDRSSRRAS